jgi:tripartite-type tricarboxylate transporter receptor subunit TctC
MPMPLKLKTLALLAALAGAVLAGPASAQNFPAKPVKLIIPYNPGGIVDYVGRLLAKHMGDALGQTVVAENRPGAGGILGTDNAARSTPDGYTMVLMDPAIVINPVLQEHMPYDLFKQLEVVSVVSSSPEVLVVAPELGLKSYQDLIAYGKANPGKLNYASAGVGTTPHLAGELFKQKTGIEATHVPYKGIGASYTDLMTNKVQFAFSSIAGALPFTTGDKVVALATTGEKRSAVYPNLPTVREAGTDFTIDLWLTVFAPTGVPKDVLAKLNAAANTALKNPELIAAFAKVGAEPHGTSPEQGAQFIKSEYAKWKDVITAANIKLN